MNSQRSKRGYALLAVISVLAMLIVFLIVIQGAIGMTYRQEAQISKRLNRSEAAASLTALVIASPETAARNRTLTAPNGLVAQVTCEPLATAHPIWRKIPAIEPQAGDELLTLRWVDPSLQPPINRYLINRRGLRPGIISFGTLTKLN